MNDVNSIARSVWATRGAFFVTGFCLAAWAPLVPLAKVRLAIDNGVMGVILLSFGLGSLLMMPLSGSLASVYGCRRVFTIATLSVLAVLPALVTLKGVVSLAAALFIFGAGVGAMDVVVNIHAVITEKRAARPIMSGFHALFSLGGIAGAGVISILLILDISPLLSVLMVIPCMIFLLGWSWLGLLDEGEKGHPFFVLPKGIVILLGSLCFIAYLMEGSILDWSGILMLGHQNIDVHLVGIGYTLFAVTMTLGRSVGDRVVSSIGPRKSFFTSALLASIGFFGIYLSNSLVAYGASFLLVGLGLSNIAPALFSLTGKQNRMPDALAVSSVSTIGYSGILLGPAIIGGIANIIFLNGAFLCVALLSCVLFLCTPFLYPNKHA